jgi:hypothetical protein
MARPVEALSAARRVLAEDWDRMLVVMGWSRGVHGPRLATGKRN